MCRCWPIVVFLFFFLSPSFCSFRALRFVLFVPSDFFFSCPSFLFRARLLMLDRMALADFMALILFSFLLIPPLFVGPFPTRALLRVLSCFRLALHPHSFLYPYRLLSSVDVFLHEQKTRAPYLIFSTHWLRMERLRCSRCICVKAIRLSHVAV